ncbi:MAG TPA: hypothetical protein IAB12_05980 [Candidatus Ornithospirochaeta avicola]|uniref:PhoU domain-containing protein n=1 Tax=Candidatus Ornithospirochaeta avicola TaxID=2840896 RepID=A0A9D1PUF6_9SPIO|nr:hypothetical protein [Candidatus Ornithospirochaeta avicola]
MIAHNTYEQIANLNMEIIKLGSLCEKSIKTVRNYITEKRDVKAELEAITEEIEHQGKEISQASIMILLRRHPVAKDLRSVSAALKIVNDLERIGNNSYDLAEVISYVEHSSVIMKADIVLMINLVLNMLTKSVDAFVNADKALAEEVIKSDDELDLAFIKAKEALVNIIRLSEEGSEDVPDVLLAAKYLERMGDHTVYMSRQLIWSIGENTDK